MNVPVKTFAAMIGIIPDAEWKSVRDELKARGMRLEYRSPDQLRWAQRGVHGAPPIRASHDPYWRLYVWGHPDKKIMTGSLKVVCKTALGVLGHGDGEDTAVRGYARYSRAGILKRLQISVVDGKVVSDTPRRQEPKGLRVPTHLRKRAKQADLDAQGRVAAGKRSAASS